MSANFIIILEGGIDELTYNRMQMILDSLGAIKINTKCKNKTTKHYYYIKCKYLDHTYNILIDQIRCKNITFEII